MFPLRTPCEVTVPDEKDERRAYPRLSLSLPVRFRGVDTSGKLVEERTETLNISSGGAWFESRSKLEPSTKLDVLISVPYRIWNRFPSAKMEGEGKVVRINEVANPDIASTRYNVAVEFSRRLNPVLP